MTRVILFSGKGGVGKTTVAAATAIALAHHGHRTLAVSLDRAHNLGDVLGARVGAEATAVRGVPGLSALEADPQIELRARAETTWPGRDRQRALGMIYGSGGQRVRDPHEVGKAFAAHG